MKNQTRPFTVVLLAPIAEQPIHALVAPSGDSILLSQDTKVSTLANIPDMIESEFGTYDEFLIEHRDQFMLFNQVASDLDPDLIFPKVHSDLLEDSLCIIRSIFAFERFKLEEEQKNATRKEPKEINQEYLMKRAIDQAMSLEQDVSDLSSNVERLQSPMS